MLYVKFYVGYDDIYEWFVYEFFSFWIRTEKRMLDSVFSSIV